MKKINKNKKGFTLLEVLIAMFIFVLVMITIVAVFGKVFNYNKKVRVTETNMEELGTAYQLMAKTMRMSSLLQTWNGGLTDTQIIMYNNSTSTCISYRFNGANLEMATAVPTNNTDCVVNKNTIYTTYIPLAGNISEGTGQFYVTPSNYAIDSLHIGRATVKAVIGGNSMQSSVSFRDYQGIL